MRVRSLTVVLGLGLVVAACGGDDDAADSTTTGTSTTTIDATTTTSASVTTTSASVQTTTTSVPTTTTTLVPGVTLPSSNIFVTTVGMGPIRIGMTVEQAVEAAGFELTGELEPDISETCYYVVPPEDQPDYEGVSFMVENDEIVRVEVGRESGVTTRSGAGVGMTETELRAMFPGQIEDASDAVIDGRALQFVPREERDADYRVIFVFDQGSTVTHLRAGILPAVGYGEGCL